MASFAGAGREVLKETKARHHAETTGWRRSLSARLGSEVYQGRGGEARVDFLQGGWGQIMRDLPYCLRKIRNKLSSTSLDLF